jgi:pimeloyl-ACP methyl ester carboxylesterase
MADWTLETAGQLYALYQATLLAETNPHIHQRYGQTRQHACKEGERKRQLVLAACNRAFLTANRICVLADKDSAMAENHDSVAPAPAASAMSANAPDEIILLIHGIRTQAEWQVMVAAQLDVIPGKAVFALKYEFFDGLRFWFPGWTRTRPINEVLWRIREAIKRNPNARVSVIAHSFGTYAIARILREHPDIRLHRLVLCGSVLRRSFRWDQVRDRVEAEIINDCGHRDIWPVLAQSSTWGYGASGTFGFGTPGIRDRFHATGHSGFFTPEQVTRFWVPWFKEGTFAQGIDPPTRPYRWSLLTVLQVKWTVILTIAVVLILALWRRPQATIDARLTLKAEPVRQRVNSRYKKSDAEIKQSGPNEEEATFRFMLHNHGTSTARVIRAEFVPSKISREKYDVITALSIKPMDHRGDVLVSLDETEVNKPVPITLAFSVEPNEDKDFKIWFVADDLPNPGMLRITGRLIVFTDIGQTSLPLAITIASDSKHIREPP